MKNTIIIILIIIVCIIISFGYIYSSYNSTIQQVNQFNKEYEYYNQKEVTGAQIATLINKAIDNNTKNKIQKDEKGMYIEDELYSIKIDIKITESNKTFPMETISKVGMDQFVENFSIMNFKCTKIEYHTKSKRVKYVLFEQII